MSTDKPKAVSVSVAGSPEVTKVSFTKSLPVSSLKQNIADTFRVPVENVTLTSQGRYVSDSRNITENTDINVIIKEENVNAKQISQSQPQPPQPSDPTQKEPIGWRGRGGGNSAALWLYGTSPLWAPPLYDPYYYPRRHYYSPYYSPPPEYIYQNQQQQQQELTLQHQNIGLESSNRYGYNKVDNLYRAPYSLIKWNWIIGTNIFFAACVLLVIGVIFWKHV